MYFYVPLHMVERPARTYIQQLSENKGCSPEDQPEAMNGREEWRERVKDTRIDGTAIYIYIYIDKKVLHIDK